MLEPWNAEEHTIQVGLKVTTRCFVTTLFILAAHNFSQTIDNNNTPTNSLMTMTKQENLSKSNSNQKEQVIIVHAEVVDIPPALFIENSNAPTESMTTDLVPVATNENNEPEPVAGPLSTTTTTEVPAPSSSISEQPDLDAMKRHRVRCQTTAGWVVGVTGLVVFGVPGAVIGGIAGNKITKHTMKRKETAARRNYELRVAQENVRNETLIAHAVMA